MCKNATRYSRTLLLCYVRERYKNATELEIEAGNNKEYEMNGIRNSTVFAKESKAGQLSEICLSGTASALTLTPLPGRGDGNEKLSWSPMSRL